MEEGSQSLCASPVNSCSDSKTLTPEKHQMPFADLRAAALQSAGCQSWCHLSILSTPAHALPFRREASGLTSASSSQLTTGGGFKAPDVPDCIRGWNTTPRGGNLFRN